jgi:membrane-bound metal-dependent hydrolase YbcI (DUF457 family)
MDLFTHIVFAYLLSFVIWGPGNPQYIAAGALAGGLPDADALLFPLARRFPLFRHHGITHSIVGVTIIAGVGCVLLPYLPYFPRSSTLYYFIAMEIGGLSHIFLDGFTHFAVSPLLPASERMFRLDADVAINAVMLSLTILTLVTLALERGTVPFGLWVETAWILSAIYGAYLVLRLVARWRARLVQRREGYSAVLPTTNPWVWTLADREDLPDRYRIRYRPLRLGGHDRFEEHRMEVAKIPPTTGPVATPQEALERTYAAALAKNRWLASRYHFGEAVPKDGGFEVKWYMVEGAPLGRALAVHGQIDGATGAMRLRSGLVRRPA